GMCIYPLATPLPYTTLFRSSVGRAAYENRRITELVPPPDQHLALQFAVELRRLDSVSQLLQPLPSIAGNVDKIVLVHHRLGLFVDRKSTRLNSSHVKISYAV